MRKVLSLESTVPGPTPLALQVNLRAQSGTTAESSLSLNGERGESVAYPTDSLIRFIVLFGLFGIKFFNLD